MFSEFFHAFDNTVFEEKMKAAIVKLSVQLLGKFLSVI